MRHNLHSLDFQQSNIKNADRWKNKKAALRHTKYMAPGLQQSQSVIPKETKRISAGNSEGNTLKPSQLQNQC
jgi:hypothetical protein